jgi:hypothetical protein
MNLKNLKLFGILFVFIALFISAGNVFAEKWNISDANFTRSFDLSAKDTIPRGIFFNSDGNKMYFVGTSSNKVHQYSLSTNWNISTASFIRSFDPTSKESSPRDVFFKSDGSEMYIIGTTSDSIHQYSLSTDWDISTASFTRSFDVSGKEINPQGLFFKNDGSEMYIIGIDSDSIHQYSLSTAWNISTASFTRSFDVSGKETNPTNVFFKSDGSEMYIIGIDSDSIHQYSLSTDWNISTASFTRSFDVSGKDNVPLGLFFKSDGSEMYFTGSNTESIHQYSIYYEIVNIPTASVDTGTYNNDFNVTLSQDQNYDIYYTTDGTDPDNTDTNYTTPIEITETTTLKFVAYDSNSTNYSDIVTKTYTMEVADPVITETTGTYNNDFTTTITSTTTDASIYYTTDGTDPDNTDTLYSGAITISSTQTLKAIAYKSGYTTSGIDSETYTMEVGGTPTADINSGVYYTAQTVTLDKNGTTNDTELYYTLDGTDPDNTDTLYSSPITININNDANTTLKFVETKTGYTSSSIITREYEIRDPYLNIQFYDENTSSQLDANIIITDITNTQTYNPDANGLWDVYLRDIDWNGQYINANVKREVDDTTTHTARNLQFYWKENQDYDINFSLLPVSEGEQVEFLVQESSGTLWTNKFVQFIDNNNANLISSNITSSTGYFTAYIKTNGDYNAVLYNATGTEGDTYIKTTVTVKKPKNEKSLAEISPYDVEVGGLLQQSYTNQTDANKTFSIFGGTTSTYDFTLVDYNADPVDRIYIPRTYNIRNPWGLGYSPTYELQAYLVTKEDGVIPSIQVYDELKRPYEDILVSIFKQIDGELTLVEQKLTDSTGRTSFAAYPLDTYYIYLYEGSTLRGSYRIEIRDEGETFYFVHNRTIAEDITYRGMDIKYNWNNTPSFINLTNDDLDINLSVYADYINAFELTGYTVNTYQNNVLIDTATDTLSGQSDTILETFAKEGYSLQYPIVTIATISFTYNGETKSLIVKRTIAVGSTTNNLLTILKAFPEKVGYLWTILLSILITITVLVLMGTSDFISRDYLLYVGLLILGLFLFIGWFQVGISVLGMDVMWFMYIVSVIATVGFAVMESKR